MKLYLMSSLWLALLAGCATQAEKKDLDQKIAAAGDVQTSKELGKKAEAASKNVPGLTPEQKAQLDGIQKQTRDRLAALREESLKVRSVLLRDLLSAKPDQRAIDAAKSRLKKISKERLDTLFSAADRTNEAIGRNEMMRQAMDVQVFEDDFNFW